jgi:acyl carrier protein
MNRQNTLVDAVADIVASILMIDSGRYPPEALTRDNIAAWDSLQQLNIILALEGEFGVKFTSDEMVDLYSVAGLSKSLAEKGCSAH